MLRWFANVCDWLYGSMNVAALGKQGAHRTRKQAMAKLAKKTGKTYALSEQGGDPTTHYLLYSIKAVEDGCQTAGPKQCRNKKSLGNQ